MTATLKLFPEQLYIGELTGLEGQPALLPYSGLHPWIVRHDSASYPDAAQFMEGVALQMLLIPQGSVKLTLFEPTPSADFSQIKRVLAQTDKQCGRELLSIEQLREHIDALSITARERFSLLASAQLDNYLDYNSQAAPSHKLSAEYLLITDILPTGGMERELSALLALCKNGSKVGIILLLIHDDQTHEAKYGERVFKPLQEFWEESLPTCQGIELTRKNNTSEQVDYAYGINLPDKLLRLIRSFKPTFNIDAPTIQAYANAVIASKVSTQQNASEQDFLRIHIGHEGLRDAYLSMGGASQTYHAMMGGTSGSGKTTLLNNILIQSCETYSPEQLQWWLFDFKAVSFAPYAGLQHINQLFLNDGIAPPPIEELVKFETLFKLRKQQFLKAAVESLEEFNEIAQREGTVKLPRHILMVDEAHNLFTDKELRPHAKRVINLIAREGRVFGLHLILITQSYQDVDLDAKAKTQMRLRLALQLATRMECLAMLGRDNEAPLKLPFYSAVYNSNFGEATDNRIVQLLSMSRDEFRQRLAALKVKHPAPQPSAVVAQSMDCNDSSSVKKTIAVADPLAGL